MNIERGGQMGLVCFRVKGNNELNQKLLSNINESGKLHMVPASVHGRYVIRFCVCAQDSKDCDIDYAWDCITDFAAELLESELVKERSGLPLPILESSNQEVGSVDHKVEMSELMELMERVALVAPAAAATADANAQRRVSDTVLPYGVQAENKPKNKLSKQLSKRQFSFTDTIEFVSMPQTAPPTLTNWSLFFY